jgi:hypothetical protein
MILASYKYNIQANIYERFKNQLLINMMKIIDYKSENETLPPP